MKVAHVGNIANIAYLNTKFLRRLGIEADLYYYDFDICLAQPEWEDANIEGEVDFMDQGWRKKVIIRDYQQPDWAHAISMGTRQWGIKIPFANPQGGRFPAFLAKWQRRMNRLFPAWQQYRVVRNRLCHLNIDITLKQSVFYFDIYRFHEIVKSYDLIQAYGLEPINCLVEQKPYIAYEFGTMRDIPFENSMRGRLLAVAYQQANQVIITNPDVLPMAKRLGLKNYVFIPHPVDEEKFCPGESQIRQQLEQEFGNDLVVLFAPARHDWAVKGTDKMIWAVGHLIKELKDTRIVLILTTWGQEIEKSKALIATEDIAHRVVWLPLLPKRKMVEYYRAADIVLDQFNIGTFGLATAEAMACGKPVVTHFDPKTHEWCFVEMPPVLRAYTKEDIFERLRELVKDPQEKQRIGQHSRDWIVRYHNWRRVAQEHIKVYRAIGGWG